MVVHGTEAADEVTRHWKHGALVWGGRWWEGVVQVGRVQLWCQVALAQQAAATRHTRTACSAGTRTAGTAGNASLHQAAMTTVTCRLQQLLLSASALS